MIRHFAQPDSCTAPVIIREIPEQTMATLASRAARAGRSTQEYLRAKLIELAAAEEPPDSPTDPAETS